jgi:hypothetical protein
MTTGITSRHLGWKNVVMADLPESLLPGNTARINASDDKREADCECLPLVEDASKVCFKRGVNHRNNILKS